MILAYIIYPFKKHSFKGRNIWIVGGNAGDLYVDNGRAIYEYLRTKDDDIFALATLVFQLMLPGKPPYSYSGGGTEKENIRITHPETADTSRNSR